MSRGEAAGNTNNIMRAEPSKSVARWGLLFVLFLLWGILSFGCTKQSISSHSSLEEFTAYIDEQIPRWMDRYQVPGVGIALIVDGKLAWMSAYGYADVDNQRTMIVDTVCRAESISKSVTGWCAAQPFLFLTAIFPSVYPWAAGVLIALAIGLLLLALYPMITRNSIERNHSENRRI